MKGSSKGPASEMVLKAQAPPERERHDWAAAAKKLKRRPGVWFLVVAGCRASTIAAIRQGSVSALRDGFEVKQSNTVEAHGDEPKRADLYLRYVPEGFTDDTTTTKEGA